MDFYQRLGYLILGSRLRRLSESYIGEINKVYQSLDISFDTSWFPFFYVLSNQKEVSLIDLSQQLQISHSSVSQMINNLRKKALVKTIKDPKDARIKLVTLSIEGKKLLKKIKPVWQAIENSLQLLEQRDDSLQELLFTLTTLENQLKKHPLADLILDQIKLKEEVFN
ncbi:MarR family transcriptional regulator [Olivibacter sp. SDN3]|uniref:MarR family winged helix-turn-helix transcriptional regulator n=1 Tax=Olivibacter sp. SDN3 TaxID=2764720 RepID=UPI0016518C2B|nr:MarR family transcriptional regulator [Olivibacter sp. SDN3]QNL48540.1 MarR family transcriptional regulator [Olivibacter sp. SDN3]